MERPAPTPICPVDHSGLRPGAAAELACPRCDRSFPVERGVVRILGETDEFYEEKYDQKRTVGFVPRSESRLFRWPLWLISSGWVWAVRRFVAPGETVVEMGCATGVAYFARRYRMIGLDVSFSSLVRVAGLYGTCLQADATQAIPLPDGSVDAILSSYVWEHIPPDRKPAVLAECARVLRPRGRLVFLYDVESRNPIYRRMERLDPDLFHEVLIEREGHLGWQSPRDNLETFDRHGFRVLQNRGKEKLFISPPMFDKVANWGGGLRSLAGVGLFFVSGIRFQLYNAFMRVFDETIGRLLPEDWSRIVVTVCEKRG